SGTLHSVFPGPRLAVSTAVASSSLSAPGELAGLVPLLSARKARTCDGNLHEWGNGDRGSAALVLAGAVYDLAWTARPVPADARHCEARPAHPACCGRANRESAARCRVGFALRQVVGIRTFP